jgi:hypothetical protein
MFVNVSGFLKLPPVSLNQIAISLALLLPKKKQDCYEHLDVS